MVIATETCNLPVLSYLQQPEGERERMREKIDNVGWLVIGFVFHGSNFNISVSRLPLARSVFLALSASRIYFSALPGNFARRHWFDCVAVPFNRTDVVFKVTK